MLKDKKLIIISGVTGIGKSIIANKLSQRLSTDIILLDIFQSYKQLNICSNKIPLEFTKNTKYLNYNKYDIEEIIQKGDLLSNEEKPNAMNIAIKSREYCNEIFSNNKIPIIEGGSVFYIKNFIEGNKLRNSENEENLYKKFTKIVENIYQKDNDPKKTFERVKKLIEFNRNNNNNINMINEIDNKNNKNKNREINFHYNDIYRLKKNLTNELFIYSKIKSKSKNNNNNNFEIEKFTRNSNLPENLQIYHFFFSTEKIKLVKEIENRCVDMLKKGLIQELNFLLKNKIIKKNLFSENNSDSNNFLKAIGISESLEFLVNFLNSQIFLKENNKNNSKVPITVDKIIKNKKNSLILKNLLTKFLEDFSVRSRKYTRKQINFVKKNNKEICWRYINVKYNEKDNEKDKHNDNDNGNEKDIDNDNDYDFDNYVNEILYFIEKIPYEDYKKYLLSEENEKNLQKISDFGNDFEKYLPKFPILEYQGEDNYENNINNLYTNPNTNTNNTNNKNFVEDNNKDLKTKDYNNIKMEKEKEKRIKIKKRIFKEDIFIKKFLSETLECIYGNFDLLKELFEEKKKFEMKIKNGENKNKNNNNNKIVEDFKDIIIDHDLNLLIKDFYEITLDENDF
jgi:tRNA A37 N6-isopentenylltransferase MiaA